MLINSYKKFTFFIILFFSNIVLTQEYEVLDKIIVTVEKDVITKLEIEKEIQKKFSNLKYDQIENNEYKELWDKTLNELIKKKLILQYAESVNINATEEDLQLVLKNITNENEITLEQLEKELIAQGTNLLEFKENLKYQLVIQKIKDKNIFSSVNISEYEVDAWLKKKSINEDTEYRLFHIFFKTDSINQNKIIEKIQKEINKENFIEYAQKYSEGPNAESGGDLGWNKLDELPSVFEDILKKLKVGEISLPFKSTSGYHILFLQNKKNEKKISKVLVKQYQFQQILIKNNTLSSDDSIEKKLENIKNQIINGLNFSDAMKNYSDDQFNIDLNRLEWVNFNNLIPEFRNNLVQYPQKKLLGPFKTELGWHLVKVIDFRESDITEETERQKAKIELARIKVEIRFKDWVDALIENSKIEYLNN